jgi:two-component system response regulator ResD
MSLDPKEVIYMEENRAGYKILVADDDPNVHQSLNAYFRREGYQMISAYDGEQAVQQARLQRPDMIILDIMMPGMDGLMLCREIRKDSNIPIIMLTAKGEEFDKLLGLEMGADDYITKPFSPREVLARVKAVLRRWQKDAPAGDNLTCGNLCLHEQQGRVEIEGSPPAPHPQGIRPAAFISDPSATDFFPRAAA